MGQVSDDPPRMEGELGHWEKVLCIVGWTAAALYSCLNVYWMSQAAAGQLAEYNFVRGWSLFGEAKDVSNYEWDFWSMWLPSILPWLVVHVAVCLAIRVLGYQYRRAAYLCVSIVALLSLMGWKLVTLLMAHILIMYAVASFGNFYLNWATTFMFLTTFNYQPFEGWMKTLCGHDPFHQVYYLFLFSIALTNMRYTAFAVEWSFHQNQQHQQSSKTDGKAASHKGHATRQRSDGTVGRGTDRGQRSGGRTQEPDVNGLNLSFGLLDMMYFCLYLPLYFYGPCMTYDTFYTQVSQPMKRWNWSDIAGFLAEFMRVLFWGCVCEWILHHFYFNALQHNEALLHTMPLWALAGCGYSLGQFFMMKYIIFYGLPRAIARLDQLEPPGQPKCISRIYRYSQMWQHFDRGLHDFLKRYLYIPLGGSRHGVPRQLLATASSFFFVFYWHGAEDYLFIWVLLNFLAITIESLTTKFLKNPSVREFEAKLYGDRMRQRIHGFLAVPLFAVSTLAIFTFLGGKTFGFISFYRLIIQGFPVSVCTIWAALYCFVQAADVIEHRDKCQAAKEHAKHS